MSCLLMATLKCNTPGCEAVDMVDANVEVDVDDDGNADAVVVPVALPAGWSRDFGNFHRCPAHRVPKP